MIRFPAPARHALHALAALALLGVAAPARAAAPDYVAPRPIEHTLDNGLRVVVFEDARLPIAQVRLFVPAGVVAEPDGQPGIAHLTGQMLRRGTPTLDAARFAAEMGALGTDLTVTVLRDYAVASAGFLAADLEAGLNLVADAVMHPLFSNEAIGRARFEVSRTLIDLHSNAVTMAEEQIWPAALDGHPYGRPPAGTVPEVGLRDRDELKAFHESRYRPGGSVLTIAGDVSAERAFELARLAFSGWAGRASSAPSIMVGPGSLRPRIRVIDLPTGARTELRIASGAPERGSSQYIPFVIANSVLSNVPGARLAHGAGGAGVIGTPVSTYTALRDAGLFVLRATVRTDSAGAAAAALRAAIADLAANPPAAAEVRAAVSLHRDTWPLGSATLAGLLGEWGDADWYGLAEEAIRGHTDALDTLDADVVGRAVARWIDPARLSILAVGPAEILKPQLETFGEVEVIRIDDSPQAEWATRESTAEDLSRGREILERGVRAHGGLAALRAMKDSSIDATVVINAQGRDVKGRLRQARREPFRFREIMNVFIYENEQVLAGDRGWVYDAQSQRVHAADSMQIATMRSSFLSDLPHQLLMATEPGAAAIDRGEETLEGRPTNLVEVRLQSEERQLWLLFDTATHELVASDVRGGIPPRVLARRVFSDFRKVKDLRLPFEEARYVQNVLVMRVQVNEMGYNIGIGDEMFAAPIAGD
jgi:zinc protease